MRDREVVASVVAGDPDGLAPAYDRYADSLYKYCRTMLSDPADAADAVQDTFVIAASRLERLRDADRLRAWLYSVARNECLRILRSRKGTSALAEAPDVTDGTVDPAGDAERAELRRLFEDATAGLNPGEREVIELQLRQGLAPAEVAAVLGVSRNHAHSLLSRARDQLEACLGVLLVGRAGRADCAELGSLLAGWDGRLTVLLRTRVHRHIEHCATCTSRRALELRPAMLRDLSPGAAMAAAAAESLRVAAGAPTDLKAHTLALATGHGPTAAAHSAAVLGRTGAFTRRGFPKAAAHHGTAKPGAGPGGHPGGPGGIRRFLRTPRGKGASAAVVIAVAATVAAFALTGNSEDFRPAATAKPSAAAPQATPPAPATTSPGPGPGAPPPPATAALATTPPPATSSLSATPTPPQRSATPTSAPTSTPARPSPTPTKPATTPTSAPTPAPTPGSLSQSPPGGTSAHPFPLFVAPNGGGTSLRLTASGSGSDWVVNWSATVTGDPNGVISVSPAASGTLTPAGPDTTLTITASRYIRCGTRRSPACPTITISPGGAVYTVWTGWGRGFNGAAMPAALVRAAPAATGCRYRQPASLAAPLPGAPAPCCRRARASSRAAIPGGLAPRPRPARAPSRAGPPPGEGAPGIL